MAALNVLNEIQPKTTYNPEGLWHSSIHAERLNRVGCFLTQPGTWWLKGLARVCLLDFRPGWWNQCDSALAEGLYRTALAVSGIALIGLVLLTAPLGAGFRALASRWKQDFVVQGPLRRPILQDPASFKVLSFNTLLMPEFLVTRNKQRPVAERVHDVAHALLKTQADVLCLQEVFHTEAAEILAKRLRKAGFHVVYNIGHKSWGLNSGLFVASKYKLNDIRFYEHPKWKAGADQHANKGLFLANCTIKGKRYVIGNTHLNGGGKRDGFRAYACRALQVMGITTHINRYVQDLGGNFGGVILSGDTNICPTDHNSPRNPAKQNRETPCLEPEWFLANILHQMVQDNRLSIPTKEEEGTAFRTIVRNEYDRIYEKHKESIRGLKLKQLLNEKCWRGGPFPTALYKHDLQKLGNYQEAIRGTTVDLESLPTVGWGSDAVAYPERVDFVTVRRAFGNVQEPSFKDTKILKMRGPAQRDAHGVRIPKSGKISSDHFAVIQTIVPAPA